MFAEEEKWRQDRLGKFTASRIGVLLQKGTKGKYFGETATKYIRSRRGEIITREPSVDLVGIKAIEWGHQYESEAIVAFGEWLGKEVRHYGGSDPKFFPHPKFPRFAGGSPDGMDIDEKVFVGEVKCPGWDQHDAYMEMNTAEEFKDSETYAKPYYSQLQFNMHCCGVKQGYFISYHPNPTIAEVRLKVIEVPYDKEHVGLINERLEEAVLMLNSGVWEELFNKIAAA